LEETIKRIQEHKGVLGMMIINGDGVAVRTSMDTTQTNSYSAVLSRLADQARSALRDLDPTNEVTFIRLRSKRNEILLAPGEMSITPREECLTTPSSCQTRTSP